MSECGQFRLVTISDCSGAFVLRYLRLCNGQFYGGNTWDQIDGFAPAIHEMRTLGGMLDLVGKVANAPGPPYSIESDTGWARIGREMNAPQLAKILDCDEQAVRDHFEPLISLNAALVPDGQLR